ncbi:phage terminase small subunit [Idiomarina abyssalis]|uniref:phage terminase small subunit n=1 Tax=Idiomarina abyssalis TaxID=86102 RepID=UPI001CD4FF95|nr:phage terminase small subunit [Idiomarina abyssalis]
MTPAEKHRQRILASKRTSDDVDASRKGANEYELMLMQLAEHKRSLKQAQSIERKKAMKSEIVSEYDAYIDGVLDAKSGQQDDVLMTLLIWHIDAGNYDRALDIAEYAVSHDLQTPDQYERTIGCLIVEEIADAALASDNDETPFNHDVLERTAELTAELDMFDQVRAKFYRAIAESHERYGNEKEAIDFYERALKLHDRVGCKQALNALKKKVEKDSESKA